MDGVDRQQKYKALYGILQLLLFQGSHLDNFPPKTLKLGWVAFDSTRFQLKCLDIRNSSQSSHVFAIAGNLRESLREIKLHELTRLVLRYDNVTGGFIAISTSATLN